MKGIFIFVCDRGFVICGEAEISQDIVFHWHLPVSSTVRKWGTKQGLAELKDGPTKDTILDTICERTLPFRSVIDIIHLTEKGEVEWRKRLYAKNSKQT